MQTKKEIQRLLGSAGVSPNKRLGQNFLIDLNLMRLLVDAAHIENNDVVLEVGCGTGSFTECLVDVAGKVVAVEFDDTLAQIARGQLGDLYNIEIINTDVLANKNSFDADVVNAIASARDELGGRLLLVANLPYNVAASVMMNLIIGPLIADSMHVTVQKEVGERMAAVSGGANYGILSILMGATGQAKFIRKLNPSVFWPQPQVDSAMVSFERQSNKVEQIHNLYFFREVVRLFMGHRRKMLKACVKFADGELKKVHNWDDIFSRSFIDPHCRGEEVSAEDYVLIANLCWEQIAGEKGAEAL